MQRMYRTLYERKMEGMVQRYIGSVRRCYGCLTFFSTPEEALTCMASHGLRRCFSCFGSFRMEVFGQHIAHCKNQKCQCPFCFTPLPGEEIQNHVLQAHREEDLTEACLKGNIFDVVAMPTPTLGTSCVRKRRRGWKWFNRNQGLVGRKYKRARKLSHTKVCTTALLTNKTTQRDVYDFQDSDGDEVAAVDVHKGRSNSTELEQAKSNSVPQGHGSERNHDTSSPSAWQGYYYSNSMISHLSGPSHNSQLTCRVITTNDNNNRSSESIMPSSTSHINVWCVEQGDTTGQEVVESQLPSPPGLETQTQGNSTLLRAILEADREWDTSSLKNMEYFEGRRTNYDISNASHIQPQSNNTLEQIISSKDTQTLRFQNCPKCGKQYNMACRKFNQNFTRHLNTHEGIWPFICKICPKPFMTSPAFRKHAMSEHHIVIPEFPKNPTGEDPVVRVLELQHVRLPISDRSDDSDVETILP